MKNAQNPFISVVIPVYNVKGYVENCVNSVIRQTFQDIEVLLIDDGSTDGSGSICDALAQKDSRITVIHQNNQGLAAARNKGIEQAQGEYIIFLDSDDYWQLNTGLQEIVLQLQGTNEKADVILFAYSKYNLKTGRKRDCLIDSIEDGEQENYMIKMRLLEKRQYYNSACTKLLLKSFIQKEGLLFPVGKKSEDLIWSRQALTKAKKVQVFTKPFMMYQLKREGSIVNSFGRRNYEDILSQIKEEIETLKNSDESTQKLGYAYWAEQACWFLGYLPMSGQPLRKTIAECAAAFDVLHWGLSKRTRLVKRMVSIIGKTATIWLLYFYLQR